MEKIIGIYKSAGKVRKIRSYHFVIFIAQIANEFCKVMLIEIVECPMLADFTIIFQNSHIWVTFDNEILLPQSKMVSEKIC